MMRFYNSQTRILSNFPAVNSTLNFNDISSDVNLVYLINISTSGQEILRRFLIFIEAI